MRTDRELLELAAKAAGVDIRWSDNYGGFTTGPQRTIHELLWDPLEDSQETMRLAFVCGISWGVARHSGRPLVIWWVGDSMCSAEMPPKCAIVYEDPLEWTRRAIVRAAAEIGAAM